MTRRAALIAIALALGLGLLLGFGTGRASRAASPAAMPPLTFSPVHGPGGNGVRLSPLPVADRQSGGPTSTPGLRCEIVGYVPTSCGIETVILDPAQPTIPVAAPGAVAPAGELVTVTNSVRGAASWYCSASSACTSGYAASGAYAAAGPALRVGDWRGRTVTVCAETCTSATLIDFCACSGRVVDLYGGVFEQLAPLSRGVVQVSVTW